ncbi:MAG: ribonuclease domain-containing protein [Atopobiaceae bacterium]|nr:ribonuclease domain-containing protein [Atopobiaceae bacterium]
MGRTQRAWIVSLLALCALLGCLFLPGCGGSVGSWDSLVQGVVESSDGESSADAPNKPTSSSASSAQSEPAPAAEPAQGSEANRAEPSDDQGAQPALDENGTYTSKDEVAWYLHTYGHLPSNFITKSEAEDEGWKSGGKSLAQACPGKSIGGDRFGNREKKLPTAKGRIWYECDIDYAGQKSRNAKRILYSNDGLIYYTEDHYQTFERLY